MAEKVLRRTSYGGEQSENIGNSLCLLYYSSEIRTMCSSLLILTCSGLHFQM